MESGYIMIDCKGFDLLSESAVTIDGLFDRLTEAMKTDKVVIAHNLEWDGKKNKSLSRLCNKTRCTVLLHCGYPANMGNKRG